MKQLVVQHLFLFFRLVELHVTQQHWCGDYVVWCCPLCEVVIGCEADKLSKYLG